MGSGRLEQRRVLGISWVGGKERCTRQPRARKHQGSLWSDGCTLNIPDSDPVVIDINESGYVAGVLAEDDTFSYCTQRDDESEFCFQSSGTFIDDDHVMGDLSCREFDDEDGLLSRTLGMFGGARTQREVPEGIGCLNISGTDAVTQCPR